jgi:hypothetical protein
MSFGFSLTQEKPGSGRFGISASDGPLKGLTG